MPPRKRGRPAAAASPEAESEAAASDNDDASQADLNHNSDADLTQDESLEPDFKFFNTTFSTFRVSPLYTAQNALTPAGLQALSRRLRDTLVGDVVRGVQVGLEGDATLGRLGALERVEWRECKLGSLLPTLADAEIGADAERIGRNDKGSEGRRGGGVRRGRETRPKGIPRLLCLELEYERATFNALMLPSLDERDGDEARRQKPPSWSRNVAGSGDSSDDEEDRNKNGNIDGAFAQFPLLLTRMPASLKAVLVDFLSTTFDCRISPLHLGTRTLIHSWERWIEDGGVSSSRGKGLKKDVALTLGFHLEPQPTPTTTMPGTKTTDEQQHHGPKGGPDGPTPPLGLKTIDVIVPADEIRRFLRVGKKNPVLNQGQGQGTSRRKRPAGADAAEPEKERLRRRKLGGGRDEEGWGWRQWQESPQQEKKAQSQENPSRQGSEIETFPQPFTDALAAYLAHHLALDVYHPGVRVLRVVCDAFALSEGRVKVFAPSRNGGDSDDDGRSAVAAVETFIRDLVHRAKGREWSQAALRLANMEFIV
ncbi:hypothetical protein GGR51DRAFT_441249 [Nemania sp. FL0031]|nr:hypothetical protein GGR51DRAFT_441249 [Nemania sp. FL0031]